MCTEKIQSIVKWFPNKKCGTYAKYKVTPVLTILRQFFRDDRIQSFPSLRLFLTDRKVSWHSFACTIIQQRHILWNFLLASFIFQILIYYKSTKYLLFYFTFVVAILRYIIIFPQTFTTFQCYLGVRYNIVFFYIYH